MGVVLVVGLALLAGASVLHPMLDGDAATQLRVIAAARDWRAIHLAMLTGSACVIVGLWARVALDHSARVSPTLIGILAVLSIGLAINALDAAFMVGAGARMAARFAAGDASMVAIFDATHQIGLASARFGNILVALAALVLGAVEWRDRATDYAPIRAGLAWLAGIGGVVGVVFFDDGSRLILAAVALLSGWQLAVAIQALRTGGPKRN